MKRSKKKWLTETRVSLELVDAFGGPRPCENPMCRKDNGHEDECGERHYIHPADKQRSANAGRGRSLGFARDRSRAA